MATSLRKLVHEVTRAAGAKGTAARGVADPQRHGRGAAANVATNAVAGAVARRFLEKPPKRAVAGVATLVAVAGATRSTVKHRHTLAPIFLLVGTQLAGLVFAHTAHGPGSVAAVTLTVAPWLWWRMSVTRYKHRVTRVNAILERKAKLKGALRLTKAQLARERDRLAPKRWRGIERVYAFSVLAAASGWLLAVALLHRAGPPMPGVLLIPGAPAAFIWWWHRRVRTEDVPEQAPPPDIPEAEMWTRKVAGPGGALPKSRLENVEPMVVKRP